ncbi:MAG: HlyD family efflux transporter periplasmic adaptor subunit [Bacteroidota bacterium]
MSYINDPIHTLENLISRSKTKNFSIYQVIILVLILTIALLPIFKVDVTSQSRGIVRAHDEDVSISTIVNGKVVYVDMTRNQPVKAGDTLLKVSEENLKSEKIHYNSLLSKTEQLHEDFKNLTNGQYFKLKTTEGKGEYRAFLTKSKEFRNKVDLAKSNFKRQEMLFHKQVISISDFETYQFELKNAREVLKSFKASKIAEWELQKQELEEQIKDLKNNLNRIKIERKNRTLTAPISGTIKEVLGIELGSFINSSQILATISPDSEIIVENKVTPKNIGLIKEGQTVKFLFDAFNYNQWGIIEGKVESIDKNITIEKDRTFFKIRCSLNSKELNLKNGYKVSVSKGMTLTTQYIISRRSLFDLIFDSIEDWLNPKKLKEIN